MNIKRTSYRGVEVFKVADAPRALGGSQALVVDLEVVPQSQLHVRHRGTEVVAIIRPHCAHKQGLKRHMMKAQPALNSGAYGSIPEKFKVGDVQNLRRILTETC